MISKNSFLLCTLLIAFLGYILQKSSKPDSHVPSISESQDSLRTNLTLLGTNDLHSNVRGLGLKLYPDMIRGGYSKLVHLIDFIR